jgi:hypothetical protein
VHPTISALAASCCGRPSCRAIIFALFYANYINGWIGTDILDWMLPRR